MAKGKYHEWLTEDGLLQIEGWARGGLSNQQICKNIGINPDTFYTWLKRFPEISDSLKKGRKPLYVEVENAMFKKALGFTDVDTIFEEVIEENGVVIGRKKRVTKKYHPPDTGAAAFVLKNFAPERWSDRPLSELDRKARELELKLKELQVKLTEQQLLGDEDELSKVDLILESLMENALKEGETENGSTADTDAE